MPLIPTQEGTWPPIMDSPARRPSSGGTGKHTTIHVTGRVSGTQGAGTILVTDGSDMKRPLPIHRGAFDQTYALDGSSFYIYASGDHFTGSLTLISKEE